MTEYKTAPIDYKVGDRVLLNPDAPLKELLITETIHDCGIVTEVEGSSISIYYPDNHTFIFKGTETEKAHINIDATIRAKDAEIEALKAQLERSNKIDEANHAFTMSLEQQLYNDPWCYDMDKAPKDGTEILIYDGCDVFTAKYKISFVTDYKPFFAKSCDGELLSDGEYWNPNPIYTSPIAWMPIPKPKGETA